MSNNIGYKPFTYTGTGPIYIDASYDASPYYSQPIDMTATSPYKLELPRQEPNLNVKAGDLRWGYQSSITPKGDFTATVYPMIVFEANVDHSWNGVIRHKVLANEKEMLIDDNRLWETFDEAEKASKKPFGIDWGNLKSPNLPLVKKKYPAQSTIWHTKTWTQNHTIQSKAKMWK